MTTSPYNKYPSTIASGPVREGWESILGAIDNAAPRGCVAFDCYPGVLHAEVLAALRRSGFALHTTDALMKPEREVRAMTQRFVTDDALFGYVTNLRIDDYFDAPKVGAFRAMAAASPGRVLLYGHGAHHVLPDARLLVFADMARWEIVQRFRAGRVDGLGVRNSREAVSAQYKRGYFNDWRIYDAYKRGLMGRVDFWVDTHREGAPLMIDAATFGRGLERAARGPFRVVPFFDPAPWGGQWMKRVCGLDPGKPNYGWCFDCVPEENSLLLEVGGRLFEMPSVNLVLRHPVALLGGRVVARFGLEFPIRFDFLDTYGGGNLSLQVHPTTQYIREQFGMHYTQDESYYLLDAADDAEVYIGLRNGIDRERMVEDLRAAQRGELVFDADRYVNRLRARKHDHYLIPAGTVHCSGRNALVLEISATPNLFTFKLWDWQRLGLDGKPRPINVEHGKEVIAWERDADYTARHLVNRVEPLAEGDGWREERTGLHPHQFIEVRRHWFTKAAPHDTGGVVNVLNLIEGAEAVVESPTGAFEPFEVHYAETFIVPAAVGAYTVRPHGGAAGGRCATIKAYVR